MDFVSANKIHTCIGVSRPGINARIRLHLTMKSIEENRREKDLMAPSQGQEVKK